MYESGIEAFLAVVSCRSFAGAAKMLNLTSSAVSHRLNNLEEQLNVILIDRRRGVRQCRPTLEGLNFYPIAERWMQLSFETKQIKTKPKAHSIIIGCIDSVNNYIMPPLYKALRDHTPPVYIDIWDSPSVDMYGMVERRELDVAFVMQSVRNRNIEVKPFFREPMKLIRLRGKNKTGTIVKANELDPEHELFLLWSPEHHLWHDHIWDPSISPKVRLDSVNLILHLMDDKHHWAIIPKSVADSFKKNRKVVIQNIDPSPPERTIFMVVHRYPYVAAKKGIEILETIARKYGIRNDIYNK